MLGLPSKTPTWGMSLAWGSSLARVLLALPNKRAAWNSSLARIMHSICFDAAESADVATCVTLLYQLLLCMQQVQPRQCTPFHLSQDASIFIICKTSPAAKS